MASLYSTYGTELLRVKEHIELKSILQTEVKPKLMEKIKHLV